MSSTGISRGRPRRGLQHLVGDLVAGLGVDLAGLGVDEVLGDVLADEVLVGRAQGLEALLGKLAGRADGELLAGLDDHLARRRR
jgi:hypothetical protein